MGKEKDIICVTRPALLPLEEFIPYLEKIWQSHQLTNNGPFHQELEKSLAEKVTQEVICLPIYPELRIKIVNQICQIFVKHSSGRTYL